MKCLLVALELVGLASWGIAASAHADDADADTVVVTAPFDLPASLDKTGTPICDVPRSIQVVPRELIDQQGATELKETLRNVSGVTQGGQFAFGFFDRFIVRGLNATYLTDGLPDGTSDLSGTVHSLTGVERVEILKGPGSALFGSTEPGGTINLVHARPTDIASASVSEQYGSYNTTTTSASLNGATGLPGLNGRLDGEFQHSSGFREQRNETGEIYGSLGYHRANHDILLRFEYHHLQNRPDASGIPFGVPSGTGRPLDVPATNTYYTPYAFANQDIKRIFLSDAWTVDEHLVVNLRGAYSDRDLDLARNAGGRLTAAGNTFSLTGRQLREQHDKVQDAIFQAEPTWKFSAGPFPTTLVTGAEARRIDAHTQRRTADLPSIPNIFSPVTPEANLAAPTFLCNASHSCNDADLDARFYGLYGIAQIDLSERLKLRFSGREDWFRTEAEGRSVIPTNPGSEHPCTPLRATTCPFVPGQPVESDNALFSWDAGALYRLADGVSVFGGYSTSSYPIFNTEEPQSVGQLPEKGTQVEAGLKIQRSGWLSLSSSLFRTTRENVYTILLVPNPAGPGNLDEAQVFSYRVKGWETDLALQPIDRLNITANFTLQTPTLTDYPQAPALVGNQVPSVPTRLANLWTSYDITLPDPIGTLQIAAGARYRNREYGDAGQTRILPGATQIDLVLAIPRDRWTLRAGVENVFDRLNYLYAAGTGSGAIPGEGRTYFASIAIKAF